MILPIFPGRKLILIPTRVFGPTGNDQSNSGRTDSEGASEAHRTHAFRRPQRYVYFNTFRRHSVSFSVAKLALTRAFQRLSSPHATHAKRFESRSTMTPSSGSRPGSESAFARLAPRTTPPPAAENLCLSGGSIDRVERCGRPDGSIRPKVRSSS